MSLEELTGTPCAVGLTKRRDADAATPSTRSPSELSPPESPRSARESSAHRIGKRCSGSSSSALPRPKRWLFVSTPRGQQRYAGGYVLDKRVVANDMPVWRQQGGRKWLYSGPNGKWCFGESERGEANFSKNSGAIFAAEGHNGRTPEAEGGWLRYDDATKEHVEDDLISITASGSWSTLPTEVYLSALSYQRHYGGRYDLQADQFANGFPVWRQAGGKKWLFSGPDGRWTFCSEEVRIAKKFALPDGLLYHPVAHGGAGPHELKSDWRAYSDQARAFLPDAGVSVGPEIPWDMPPRLYLASPLCQQPYAGEYALLEEVMANGMPVWRQRGGNRWLYSSPNGKWCFGAEDVRRKNFDHNGGHVYCATQHGGQNPEVVHAEGWRCFDGDAKVHRSDSQVLVTPDPPWAHRLLPRQLKIERTATAGGPLAGLYHLSDETWSNGFPVWQRRSGQREWWLYTAPSGRWVIGGVTTGDLAGPVGSCGGACMAEPHGGRLPLGEGWNRADAAATSVSGSSRSRAPQSAGIVVLEHQSWSPVSSMAVFFLELCPRRRRMSETLEASAVLSCQSRSSAILEESLHRIEEISEASSCSMRQPEGKATAGALPEVHRESETTTGTDTPMTLEMDLVHCEDCSEMTPSIASRDQLSRPVSELSDCLSVSTPPPLQPDRPCTPPMLPPHQPPSMAAQCLDSPSSRAGFVPEGEVPSEAPDEASAEREAF